MKKKIMILGAGIYQLPAIIKAKEMNFETIVCSIYPDDPGMSIADKPYDISTIEKEKILNVATQEKISGIITIASEIASPIVSYVAHKLQLPAYDYQSAKTILNKYLLRKTLKENGLPGPKFVKAKNISEAFTFWNEISDKAMIKPLESSGSRGVHLVTREEDIIEHFDESCKFSFAEKGVIIEEFMEGIDIGAECLIYNGKLIFFKTYKRYLNEYFVPIVKSVPARINKKIESEVKKLVTESIRILKLNSGALNFQIIITNKDPLIVDLGARLGGGCLPLLMEYSTGVDTVKAAINMALGQKPEIRITKDDCYGAKIIGSNNGGILKNITPIDEVKEKLYGYIIDIRYDYKLGDTIHKFDQGSHRIGHIIFKYNCKEDIEVKNKEIDEILKIEVCDK